MTKNCSDIRYLGSNRGRPSAPEDEWTRPAGPNQALLERYLLDGDDAWMRDEQPFPLGQEAAKEIQLYLSHPSREVKSRALCALSKIPEIAAEEMIAALRSPDHAVRYEALRRYALPLLRETAVLDAYVAAFVAEAKISGGDIFGHSVRGFLASDPEIISAAAPRLVAGLLDELDSYSAPTARAVIIFLGKSGKPGDSDILLPLVRLQEEAPERAKKQWNSQRDEQTTRREVEGVLEAILFAEANLGVEASRRGFIDDIANGPIEVRHSRLGLWHEFRATHAILAATRSLLDDKTPISNVNLSGSPTADWIRPCDYAVRALFIWFKEFPFPASGLDSYRDEQLALARTWLDEKLAADRSQ